MKRMVNRVLYAGILALSPFLAIAQDAPGGSSADELAKNFKGGHALTLNSEILRNREAVATVGTLHLVGSKVTTLGGQLVQYFIGPRIPMGNGNNASWGFRAGMVLLLPK